MTDDPAPKDAPAQPPPRWPKVLGTLGAVLGTLIVFDKVSDLALIPLMWADGSRNLLLGPEMGALLARSLPRGIWLFFYIVCGGLLGLLLLIASLRMRRRERSGATLTRVWAWLSIGWLGIGLGGALWWLVKHSAEISQYAGPGWDRGAFSGALVALLLLTYPVFLLVWLSRASVKKEVLTWRT